MAFFIGEYMGIDYYIGEKQVRITNAYWYDEFRSWVIQMGDFPQILNHSPVHGNYELGDSEASLYTGSVKALEKEILELMDLNKPEYAADILKYMLEGVQIALRDNKKITLDDGAWK